MYEYKAKYIRNYDGDTITFLVNLGFRTYIEIDVRVLGIDTSEIKGGSIDSKRNAIAAKYMVEQELKEAKSIIIKTRRNKKGLLKRSFTRYLADVIYNKSDDPNNKTSIAELLLNEGLANIYKG